MKSDVQKHVVILDSDSERANQLASLVDFLEYQPRHITDEASLRTMIGDEQTPMTILAHADNAVPLLNFVLDALVEADLSCACYLIQEQENAPVSGSVKQGVQDIITAPVSYKKLLGTLHEAELISKSKRRPRSQTIARLSRRLVGTSRDIRYVGELINQVAGTEATVLILGESGTGKELVASNVHGLSRRRDKPFVPVNCGAIPAELLESELFGHEKGAFTGAISSRQGRFEMAEGGTLFLDEIGDMPMNMQVKLLRVLQEKTFERVGSNKTVESDVRIVAATHQNLEQLVTEGKFRTDLFYRLNVFPIEVPALRERLEDVPLLVKALINRMEMEKRGSLKLSDAAMAGLTQYHWPGNVRELFNLIERLAILYPHKEVGWSDLPEKLRPNKDWVAEQLEAPLVMGSEAVAQTQLPALLPPNGVDLKAHLANIECSLMTQALEQSDWVVARAAKLLNLQRTTLVEKMRKFEISRPEDMPEF